MNRNERKRLADKLESQGAVIRKTRAGFMAKNPDTGATVSWHESPSSDSRAGDKNTRADILRAGFDWPFAA